jgi:hypothetical protein
MPAKADILYYIGTYNGGYRGLEREGKFISNKPKKSHQPIFYTILFQFFVNGGELPSLLPVSPLVYV